MFDPYETEAEQRIKDWHAQSQSSIPFIGAVSDVVSGAMDVALSLPGARNVVAQVDEVIKAGFGVAALSIDLPAVVAKYQADGAHDVSDIRFLSLQRPDDQVSWFGTQYAATAGGIGLAGGLAPLVPGVGTAVAVAALGAELVAVTGLALRSVCDYSAHYGYDPTDPAERAFMLGVVAATGMGAGTAQRAALSRELITVSELIAKRATWEQLRRRTSVQTIERAASLAGKRLVKRQMGVIVPIVGGVVSAAADSWYLSQVHDAATHLYGHRFLTEKKARSKGERSTSQPRATVQPIAQV